MKQRFSSREHDVDDDDDVAAAARARGFSRLTKFMKVTNNPSSTTTPTPYDHNSLLISRGRLPQLSKNTEFPNQEDLYQEQPTSSNIRMYTCKTCGRKFESFQALGGHRASHMMKLVGVGVGEDGRYQNFQYRAKLHRCSICDKGYQTGQALGGHMRKHRELLDNQRLAVAAANNAHQLNRINSALRCAHMNTAATYQYLNPAWRYNNAPHYQAQAGRARLEEAEDGLEEGEILEEKAPHRRGFNLDLNLDIIENEELGLVNDEW